MQKYLFGINGLSEPARRGETPKIVVQLDNSQTPTSDDCNAGFHFVGGSLKCVQPQCALFQGSISQLNLMLIKTDGAHFKAD